MAWKKILLEGDAAVLSDTAPVDVDTAVAAAGIATEAARQDHKHDVGDLTGMMADTIAEKTVDAGVTVDGCLIKDGLAADSNKLEGDSKATVQDHTPKAHTLAAHTTPVGPVDCGQQQLDGMVLEAVDTPPDSGTEIEGQVYFDSGVGDKHPYVWVP